MTTYRLYMLGDRHREIRSYKEFDAATDSEAIALADDLRGLETVELWSCGRRVKRFESLCQRPFQVGMGRPLEAAS